METNVGANEAAEGTSEVGSPGRRAGTVQCSSDCQFVFENCHAVISILVISNRRSCVIFLRNICPRVYIKTMKFSSKEQLPLHFLSSPTCL